MDHDSSPNESQKWADRKARFKAALSTHSGSAISLVIAPEPVLQNPEPTAETVTSKQTSKTEGPKMPAVVKRYDKETKAKFLAAVKQSRAAGQPFAEQFTAAKAAGYEGSEPALMQMMYRYPEILALSKGKRGRPKAVAAAPETGAVPTAKKVGRPRKSAAAAAKTADLSSIEAAINGIVRERVAGVIGKIRAALDEAERQV